MTRAIQLPATGELERRTERREHYARASKAEGTWKVYGRAWDRFERRGGTLPASPELVADYVISMADEGLSESYISLSLSAIAHRHRASNLPVPTEHPQLLEIVAGIRRKAPAPKEAEPLLPSQLRKLVSVLRPAPVGLRDLALLSFGIAGGFRRSELAAMELDWLRFDGKGFVVHLPRSKRDQEGEGHDRRICPGDHIETCPVHAMRSWLSSAAIESGPVFRPFTPNCKRTLDRHLSVERIDAIVRAYVRRAKGQFGDEAFPGTKYSAHSLRAGCVTACAVADKPEWQIREHVGHKSAQTTARYIRAAKLRVSTVTEGIGL